MKHRDFGSGQSTGRALFLLAAVAAVLLSGCDDAVVASRNVSKASDNFEVARRIVFFNGITDNYLLEIVGRCSIEHEGGRERRNDQLEVICKVGESADGAGEYKKHFLGLSDNVSYFVEHLEATAASAHHYRVTFKPQTILPDVDFRGGTGGELPRDQN